MLHRKCAGVIRLSCHWCSGPSTGRGLVELVLREGFQDTAHEGGASARRFKPLGFMASKSEPKTMMMMHEHGNLAAHSLVTVVSSSNDEAVWSPSYSNSAMRSFAGSLWNGLPTPSSDPPCTPSRQLTGIERARAAASNWTGRVRTINFRVDAENLASPSQK